MPASFLCEKQKLAEQIAPNRTQLCSVQVFLVQVS